MNRARKYRARLLKWSVGALCLGLNGLLAGTAHGQDFSPLTNRFQRPYSLLFLRFQPAPLPLGLHEQRWEVNFSAGNSLLFVPEVLSNPRYQEDIEADRVEIRYAKGLGNGYQIQGELPIESLGPGFMDPVIDWYHRTILHLNNIRSLLPYGRHIVYSPSGGPFTGGVGIADTSLFLSKSVGGQTFFTAGLKLPTGNPNALLGSGRPDFGLAGQTTVKLLRPLALVLNAGVIAQGAAVRLQYTRSLAFQGGFSFVYSPNLRDSWIIQTGYESSPTVEGIPSLDKINPTTSFAYRRWLTPKQALTAFFAEDINPLNPNWPNGANVGPDFVIGLGWSLKL